MAVLGGEYPITRSYVNFALACRQEWKFSRLWVMEELNYLGIGRFKSEREKKQMTEIYHIPRRQTGRRML